MSLKSKYEKAMGRKVSISEAIRLTLEFLPLFTIGRYSLLLFSAVMVFAQDCRIPINFSVSSGTVTPSSTSAPFNNKAIACVNWQMNIFASGVSASSIQLESAADLGGNTPGTFSVFGGTVLSGSNPTTTTTQSTTTFTGLFPWVRVNATSISGTGNVVGVIYGFKATSSSISPIFGGGVIANACSGIVALSCTPPRQSNLSSRNLLAAVLSTYAGGAENIYIPEPNFTGNPERLTGRETSTVPATPYSVTVAMMGDGLVDNAGAPGFEIGIYFRDATDKAVGFEYGYGTSFYQPFITHWNPTSAAATARANPTGVNSSTDENSGEYVHWMMVINDGVNFTFCRSRDGFHFYKFHLFSEAVGAFIGVVTQIGYFLDDRNGNYAMNASALSFNVTSGTAAIAANGVCTA